MGFVGPVQRAAFQADAAPGTGYEPGSEEEAGFEDGASFEQDHDLIMAEAQRLLRDAFQIRAGVLERHLRHDLY